MTRADSPGPTTRREAPVKGAKTLQGEGGIEMCPQAEALFLILEKTQARDKL